MVIGVHQPHYMPWLGYLDKMAKSDLFVIYDRVQFEKGSPMCRNRILGTTGGAEFITVGYEKHGLLQKECRYVEAKNWNEVRDRHIKMIKASYGHTEYFDSLFPEVNKALPVEALYMIDIQMQTVEFLRRMFDINTPLLKQSEIAMSIAGDTATERLIGTIEAAAHNCDEGITYISGNGARKYNDIEVFKAHGINIVYQAFKCPEYKQVSSNVFVPNLSALDLLFNCGIEESRKIFWENVRSSHELDNSR